MFPSEWVELSSHCSHSPFSLFFLTDKQNSPDSEGQTGRFNASGSFSRLYLGIRAIFRQAQELG